MSVFSAAGALTILTDPSLPDGPLAGLLLTVSPTLALVHTTDQCRHHQVPQAAEPDALVILTQIAFCSACFRPGSHRALTGRGWSQAASALHAASRAAKQLDALTDAMDPTHPAPTPVGAALARRIVAAGVFAADHPYGGLPGNRIARLTRAAVAALDAVIGTGGELCADADRLRRRVLADQGEVLHRWHALSREWRKRVAGCRPDLAGAPSQLLALGHQDTLGTEWAADAWKQPGRAALLTAEVRGRGEHVAVVELDAPMLAELTESLNGPYVTVPATAVDDATLAVALAALDAAAGAGQELALPRALDAARASLQEAGSAR